MNDSIDTEGEDYLAHLLKEYYHPSIALWRAIEVKAINRYFRKNSILHPILDLGCGDGKVSKYIFGEGEVDYGLEIDSECVLWAKELNIYKNLIIADAQAFPFRQEYFNLVFSNCVIEHIPDNEKVLKNVTSSLKNGSLLIFTVPSNKFGEYLFFYSLLKKSGLKKLANSYSKTRNELLNHYHCYEINEWKEKLNKYNLEYVEHHYYLSPKTVKVWDFMAAIIYLLERVRGWRLLEKIFNASPVVDQFRIRLFRTLLSPFYKEESDESGGGVLIVARKGQGCE
ncbi:MAG: Trans-aconitate 2-methyltransferase [candidate division WS2 bacterium]|nr:Trans-aconitate 2-methyltransferase [Candidatus Lithacetigena glycinireducens]